MDDIVEVRVLGRIDAVIGATVTSVGSRSAERLIALLVASGSGGISLSVAAEELWPGEDGPHDTDQTLRTYLSRLRSVLGREAVVVSNGVMRLSVTHTDADQFEELVARARQMEGSPTAGELWSDAVAMWRGEPFAGHDDLPSVRPVATRLDEKRAEALEVWIGYRLGNGEHREVIADLGAAINDFPLREGFRAQRMTALAGAGRQVEALREFQEFRAGMTEIGLEPSPALVDLEQRIVADERLDITVPMVARDYRMAERIGEGAFSVVYRAEQTSVGRDVAVKQIRSELANRPGFIRLFEAEAQLVASLEHPHIVPLYDFWREPGSAYLVMRYLRGGSLASKILDAPLEPVDVAHIVLQVADALDEAHRRGVIHRDIKPDNVLLDEDGRAYLSDFGIAVDELQAASPEVWLSNGSPAYASPEQLRRQPVGPTSDVHGLGIAAFEALTGQLPFPGETTVAGLLERQLTDPIPLVASLRDGIPVAVDAVLQRATAKSAEQRYESAGDFARALALSVGVNVSSPSPAEDRNPYKGLLAYTEADAADFVGRDRLIDHLVAAVADQRLVTVVGPSGSGKSSVVRAGLIPAVRQGRVRSSDAWWITTMTPGTEPFANLADALARVATSLPVDLIAYLMEDTRHLTELLRRTVPADRELLLVVDQLEELFTLSSAVDQRRFLDAIEKAVTDDQSRLRIVQTLRADFFDRPLRHPRFAQLIEPGTVTVHPLAADELERAITIPAERVGTRFEPGLVASISADVADQPGALPLLQYTLMRLYDQRTATNTITAASYRQLGGVSGALASQAEELYQDGSDADQLATRRLFGRLVNLGEGTEDTRRRVRRSELGAAAAIDPVIDRFGGARLLAFDRDPSTREPTIEVAHEALIREWPRLRSWLDDDRDGLRSLRHMTAASTEWTDGGRSDSDLYRGARLETALDWAGEKPDDLSDVEQEFLAASQARQADVAQKEKREIRRLRRSLATVAVVAVVALIAGVLAFTQSQRADDQTAAAELAATQAEDARVLESAERERAQHAELVARATSLADDRPSLALLLAAEAYDRNPTNASESALLATLGAVPMRIRSLATGRAQNTSGTCITSFGVGQFIVHTAGGLGLVDASAMTLQPLDVDSPCQSTVSNDGRLLAAPQREGGFVVWDIDRNELVAESEGLGGTPSYIAFSPDDSRLLVAFGSDNFIADRLALIDVATGSVLEELAVERPISGLAWAPTGEVLFQEVTEFGRRIISDLVLRDGPSGAEITRVPGVVGIRPIVGWASDGVRMWVGSNDFTGRTLDRRTGELLQVGSNRPDEAHHFAVIDPDRFLILGQVDSGLGISDPMTYEEVMAPVALSSLALAGSFLDDDTVAVVLENGVVEVLDLRSAGGIAEASLPCCRDFGFVGVSPDDEAIGVRLIGLPDRFRILLPADGTTREILFSDLGLDPAAVFSAITLGSGRFEIFSFDMTSMIVDIDGTVLDRVDYLPDRNVRVLTLNRNGPLMMFLIADLDVPDPTGTAPGQAEFIIVDTATSQLVGPSYLLDPLSPDAATGWYPLADGGAVLAAVASGRVTRHDSTGQIIDTLNLEPGIALLSGFDPEGRRAALRRGDGTTDIIELDTLEVLHTIAQNDATWMLFIDQGRRAVLTDQVGSHVLYDLETGTTIGELLSDRIGRLSGATVLTTDGSGVWLTGGDEQLLRVSINASDWRDRACDLAGRDITEQEWADFVPGDEAWRPICS